MYTVSVLIKLQLLSFYQLNWMLVFNSYRRRGTCPSEPEPRESRVNVCLEALFRTTFKTQTSKIITENGLENGKSLKFEFAKYNISIFSPFTELFLFHPFLTLGLVN